MMAAKFAHAMHAAAKRFATFSADKAVTLIKDWEDALKSVNVPGAKGIAGNLGPLRTQIESDNPATGMIATLIEHFDVAMRKMSERAENGWSNSRRSAIPSPRQSKTGST